MKHLALICGIVLSSCLGFVSKGNALLPKPVVAVGGSFPVGPSSFTDNYGPGIALSGGIRQSFIPRVAILFEVGYYRHFLSTSDFESNSAPPNVSISGGDAWVIPITVSAELDLIAYGAAKPFLRAGAGIYRFGNTDFKASGSGSQDFQEPDLSETVFGTVFGIGVRTPIAVGVSLFLDANYHIATTQGDTTTFIPLRAGLRF